MPIKALVVVGPNEKDAFPRVIKLEKRLREIGYMVAITDKSPEIPEETVPVIPVGTLWSLWDLKEETVSVRTVRNL